MLHLHPDLVHFDRAVDDQVARATSYEVLPVQPEFVTESGSLWKATRASAEKGERAWKEIVAPLAEAILTELPAAGRLGGQAVNGRRRQGATGLR